MDEHAVEDQVEIFPTVVANSTVAPNVGLKIALLRSRTGRTRETGAHQRMTRRVGGRPGGFAMKPWTRRMLTEEEHQRTRMTMISTMDVIKELRSTNELMTGRNGDARLQESTRRTSEQTLGVENLKSIITEEKLETSVPRSDEMDPTSMTERHVISSRLML